jgi:hypothetical protein
MLGCDIAAVPATAILRQAGAFGTVFIATNSHPIITQLPFPQRINNEF